MITLHYIHLALSQEALPPEKRATAERYMNGSFEKCQNARNCLKGRALRWVHLMFTRLALSVACRFVQLIVSDCI